MNLIFGVESHRQGRGVTNQLFFMGFEEDNYRVTPAPSFESEKTVIIIDLKISSWTLLLTGAVWRSRKQSVYPQGFNSHHWHDGTTPALSPSQILHWQWSDDCMVCILTFSKALTVNLIGSIWDKLSYFFFFFFKPGTVLNAWEKGKGYCLQMWMSAMSQSRSTLNQRFHFLFQCKIPIFYHELTLMVYSRARLGVDMTAEVKAAAIRLPSVRMKIPNWHTVGFVLRRRKYFVTPLYTVYILYI